MHPVIISVHSSGNQMATCQGCAVGKRWKPVNPELPLIASEISLHREIDIDRCVFLLFSDHERHQVDSTGN